MLINLFLINNLYAQNTEEKIALIVAIGEYAPSTQWSNINSLKDVPLIEKILQDQGFSKKNILVITNKKATKKGIVDAIESHLIANVKEGAHVVFHYSGHGQQVFDVSGDEFDGFDEAIVPYDANMRYQKGVYEGERHLIDDEIEVLFNKIREKIGPSGSFLAVLDACHSGTATRGIAPTRGTSEKLAPENYKPSVKDSTKEVNTVFSNKNDNKLAPMIVFSGASANQLNYETKDDKGNFVGSLSYAFSRSMANAKTNFTFRNLFDLIKMEMSILAPMQNPIAEGDLDLSIFGGNVIQQPIYFLADKIFDDSTFTLKAGNLQGLHENTKIGIFPLGTVNINEIELLATGVIKNSKILDSDVFLDKPLAKEIIEKNAVYITEKSFGNISTTVKIDIADNKTLKDALEKIVSENKNIVISNENPDLVIEFNNQFTKSRGADVIQIISSDEQLISSEILKPGQSEEMLAIKTIEKVKDYSRGQFIKNIELSSEHIQVEMELIPVEIKRRGSSIEGEIERDLKEFEVNGEYIFPDNISAYLKLKNKGTSDTYFTILNIEANNELSVIIPSQFTTVNDFIIKAGEEKYLTIQKEKAIFQFSEPYGNAILKLIATKEPLDLRPIVNSRGATRSAGNKSNNPFELLLQETFTGTRGLTNQTVPSTAGSTTNLIFKVVKAQN